MSQLIPSVETLYLVAREASAQSANRALSQLRNWRLQCINLSFSEYMLGIRQWRHGAFCVSRQHRLRHRWPRRIVFIHRLWNKVYHQWITNNFPCKWHTSTKSGSKSSPRNIFRRNSSGARTPVSATVVRWSIGTKQNHETVKQNRKTQNKITKLKTELQNPKTESQNLAWVSGLPTGLGERRF